MAINQRTSFAACVALSAAAIGLAAGAAIGEWTDFDEQTSLRLVTDDPAVGAGDVDEKYYVWGDVNNNGRVDLIVVRKQPFTTPGKRRNALYLNEGVDEGWETDGVLVDRTAEYATASDVPGDEGFLTPTNDRAAVLVDVNNNGWLDLVTAVAVSDGDPKHISHPRLYINQGEIDGQWQGFLYENDRIPQLAGIADNGQPHAPRFTSVAAGDVTGNGYPDLYFGDSDYPSGSQTFNFNDRLLINDGEGFFTDETADRIPEQWLVSGMSAAVHIADLNGNGVSDIVKHSAIAPYEVRIIYNDPANPGHFIETQLPTGAQSNPAYVQLGDLNNNGLLDMVVTDDGLDRYLLNTGSDGLFIQWSGPNFLQSSIGFRDAVTLADLGNDGWLDILVADAHIDIPTCSGSADIHRNNTDGVNVTFTHDLGNIPDDMLTGTFHIAAFDLTGNGWNDLVVGRCAGVQIWINQGAACPADLTGDGAVGGGDLGMLLSAWGPCQNPGDCPADLTGSGTVGGEDLGNLLAQWGSCP